MQGCRRAFLDLYRSLTDLGLSSSLWLLLVLPHATLSLVQAILVRCLWLLYTEVKGQGTL